MEKRVVYDGYQEMYLNGSEIKEYFKNSYELFEKHHSQVSSKKINFETYYKNIKNDVLYRVFINDTFCMIMSNITDKKIYFFGYTNVRPSWAKD